MEIPGGSQTISADKQSIQLLATVAIMGICLFIALIIILHFLPTGYNPVQRPTSEYAVGKYGFLMTIAFLAMSIGSFAMVAALNKGFLRSAKPKLGLILLTIWSIGVLIAMIFPIDPDRAESTMHGKVHEANGPITFLSLTLGVLLVSLAFKRDQNWHSVYQRALLLSLIMVLIFISVGVSFATGLNYVGLLQRSFLVTVSIWFIMVASHLRRICIHYHPANE